jgi:glutathione S-transferase
MKLYYSTGSCSLAAHIGLEEAGAKFEAQRLNLQQGDQRKPEYLNLNWKGKVPTLVLDDGQVLTENPAILSWVADNFPQAKLLAPPGQLARARAQEWLAWCAAGVHPQFGILFGGGRLVDGEEAQKSLVEKVRGNVQASLDGFDRGLAGKKFVLGDSFSIADAYTLVFFAWANRMGLKVGENHRASARVLLARPGVQRALTTQDLKIEA